MALIGLRMRPMFPSPPLKSRTVGFPQYGFKASISDDAFLREISVKPAPGMPSRSCSLLPSFARFPLRGRLGSASKSTQASSCRCAGGLFPPYPRGPWLRSELCCLDPSLPNPTPCASPAGTSQLRFYAYMQRLCCAGAPRHPTGPSLLSLTALSMHAANPTPVVHHAFPLYSHGDSRLPRICTESPPTTPVSASNTRRVIYFGAASFSLCYGLHLCLALQTGYDKIKPRAFHLAF